MLGFLDIVWYCYCDDKSVDFLMLLVGFWFLVDGLFIIGFDGSCCVFDVRVVFVREFCLC